MEKSKISQIIAALMILNGLFFISNIYVFGNHEAAVAMHNDLSPDAGPFIAMTKVMVCFFTGICYFVAGIGVFLSKKTFVRLCVFGSLFFFVLYIVELILWGSTHTSVWIDFSIFGGLSVFFGLFSYKYGKAKREKYN